MLCGRLDQQIAALLENSQAPKEEIGAIYEEPRNSLSGSISSADAESYTDVIDVTRELPSIPVDNLASRYSDIDNTAVEVANDLISNKPQIDSGISSSKVEVPYSRLESSTREPPPAPISYDSLVKPIYVNTYTDITNDVISGITCDEPQCDSGISLYTKPSSDMETIV